MIWRNLTEELDAWTDAGRRATLWWRDDDAVEPGPALARLLGLAGERGLPLALAVIPARASEALAEALGADPARTTPLQHGYAHRNHAPASEKKVELGAQRPANAVLEQLMRGRGRRGGVLGDATEDETLVECLRRVPVQPGDVIDVPPGMLHAVCGGVMLLEIQEPSDSTLRVYDYGRPGEDGQPRPLHIEEALLALRLGEDAPAKLTPRPTATDWGEHESLIENAQFRVERLSLRGPALVWQEPKASPAVLVVLAGAVTAVCGADSMRLGLGQTCILPPAMDPVELRPDDEAVVILAAPGTA